MFPGGIFELLKQVISSWQVIAVTLGFILYVFIVNYTARRYHRPRVAKKIIIKKPKPASKPEKKPSAAKSNDDLGLEEEEQEE